MKKEILTYIQLENSVPCDFSYSLISYAKEISNENFGISAVLVINKELELSENVISDIKKFGADKLYIIKTSSPSYDKTMYPEYIFQLVQKINPFAFILTSTSEGREIAPIVAAKCDTGLTADCTKLEIVQKEESYSLVSTRPTFGGKLMASIVCKRTPQMATVRSGIFNKKNFPSGNEFEIEEFFPSETEQNHIKILNFEKNDTIDIENLEGAKVILAGGMGLKNKENFDKLKKLAKKIGASVGATRKAVDKGFIEKKYQIGQTGKTVTPDLYVAFGIKGAIHHISGMENSKKIIAINTDKTAPIFDYADIGIVMDAVSVLDKLL